jgi:dihydrodipicolinate synthase/N-acetylneuraminate lyase
MSLPKPLKGIVPPLLTPLLTPDAIDLESLERLLEHVIDGGVHGLFVLGTTGEGPALGLGLAKEFIARAASLLRGRLPLLVGVTHASTPDSLALARAAADAGADAVVTAGPCYFPIAQPELAAWAKRFAAASPLPVFLYNMPSHAHLSFDESTVLRIADEAPNVVGLKDSSGELMYLHGLVRSVLPRRADFTLMIGPEEITPEAVLFGVHGGVNGGANLFPRLYVEGYRAAVSGDVLAMRTVHARVLDISRRLYSVGVYGASSYLAGIKCAAAELGLIRNVLAAPYPPFAGAERERVRAEVLALAADHGMVTAWRG